MWSTRSQTASAMIAAIMGCCSAAALAQSSFPSKPIRIIHSTAAGSAMESQTRIFTGPLSQSMGQPIVIEVRSGLHLAGPLVAKAPPDGHTWLLVGASFTSVKSLSPDLPVDPIKDFAPITMISGSPYFLVVNASSPARDIPSLIQLAKTKPGALNFSAGLPGSGTHLMTVWFFEEAGIKATYVPYKSAGTGLLDLAAGRLDGGFSGSGAMTLVRAGKLRILGSTLPKRTALTKDIPTIAEQGVPDFVTINFRGFVTAAATPPAIVDKIAGEFAKLAKQPEILKLVNSDGSELFSTTPAEFRKFLVAEVARYAKLIKENNITGGGD